MNYKEINWGYWWYYSQKEVEKNTKRSPPSSEVPYKRVCSIKSLGMNYFFIYQVKMSVARTFLIYLGKNQIMI